jgi:uncharacterized protein (DUF1015 family)
MQIRPFRAVRPKPEFAAEVAALPYDVMNSAEARAMTQDKPLSFLHVDKAEIDLNPQTNPYDEAVYQKAACNLKRLIDEGVLIREEKPCYYLYRLTMDGNAQTGFVACPAADDYRAGNIKKHELTRADKEQDRIRHVDRLNANTGPIFLTCRPEPCLEKIKTGWMATHAPLYDFTAEGGVRHTVWVIDETETVAEIERGFTAVSALYIADGHHRCASAIRVAEQRRSATPNYTGAEEFNYFLSVIFPSDELHILDYNRVVKDLNGLTAPAFMERVAADFHIGKAEAASPTGEAPVRPRQAHQFGMFLEDTWYQLTAKKGRWDDANPVERLDVSILQNNLLSPILGIQDPRTDKRIDFVGGIRGLTELERRVHTDMKVAFSLYPTSVEELMTIADAGLIMPPKSTWFEPKLLSGLFIHELCSSQ